MPLVIILLTTSMNLSVLTIDLTTVDPKQPWLDALHQCENPNNIEKVWDVNNQWSYGKYQWQMKSWLNYKKQGATKENIGSDEMQDKVTRYVLDNGGWRNWYRCGKKLNATLGLYAEQV